MNSNVSVNGATGQPFMERTTTVFTQRSLSLYVVVQMFEGLGVCLKVAQSIRVLFIKEQYEPKTAFFPFRLK